MTDRIKEALNSNMKWKFIGLILRFILFVVAATLYFTKSSIMEYPVSFFEKLLPLHFLWLAFMILFVSRLFGKKGALIARNRVYAKYNNIVLDYNREKLKNFIKKANLRIIWIIALALIFNIPWWICYHRGIIDEGFLVVMFLFLFFLDMICETLWCPFQRIFMKNRCCHVCRIFAWDSLLAISPLIIIPSFFSWTLVAVAAIEAIHFEIKFYKHPEYFWDGSNAALRCSNCTTKMCVVRGKRA